jgi:hypothetical protein
MIFYLKIEPSRAPLVARRRALEGDVTRLQTIPKSESDASRYPVGFHPTQLVIKAKKIKKRLYPNVGLAKMSKDAKEGDGVGVQVQQRKAIEIQHEKKKFGRRRNKTTSDVILNYDHAAQDGFRFSTSNLPLHGPATGKGTVVLKLLHGRGVRRGLCKIHRRRRIAEKKDEGGALRFFA